MPETHVFVDDYTGTSMNRPQFKQLRDLVQQLLVQAVIVHDLDRLSRKLAHQLLLSEEFEQAGVALHRRAPDAGMRADPWGPAPRAKTDAGHPSVASIHRGAYSA